MNFATLIFALSALLSVYVISDKSWETLSRDFPLFTNSTAGPYVFLVGSLLYGYAVKRAFDGARNNSAQRAKNDSLAYAGVQLSALSVLGLSFTYSFNVVNEFVALKYFLLLIALLITGLFGLFYFTAAVKELDSSSNNMDSEFISNVFEVKTLLHDLIVNLRSVDDRHYVQERITMLSEIDRKKDRLSFQDYLVDLVRWIESKEELRTTLRKFNAILEEVAKK